MKFFNDYAEAARLVNSVTDNGGVWFVPTFIGVFCPYWNHTTHGAIYGLSSFT